ncbi:protein transporter Sec31 [Kitasatospora purpeofusca]|uniref:protein transporter Sec31 n=1 Tax=Kitasatospora purpeofusca TaxID=67352 RepID=UPI00364BE222
MTRIETRTQLVPHTIDGRTHLVPHEYQAPKPPRDWDQTILGTITGAAIAVGAGCIAWSTSSIGTLLGQAAPRPVAYAGAAVFDTLWLACLGLEWLARYEPAKAAAAHRAGLLCLAIAVLALGIEGYTGGHIAAGIVGAFISIGTKRLWTLVLARHARRLDPLTQAWVEQEMDDAGAQVALATIRRRLGRERALAAAHYATVAPDAPTTDGPDPDKPRGHRTPADATVRSAVRAALTADPEAAPDVIVERLARVGIDTDEDTVRTLSGQPDSRSATLHDLDARRGTDSLTDTVRHLVRTGVTDDDTLLALVRYVHGDTVKADSVRRLAQRVG